MSVPRAIGNKDEQAVYLSEIIFVSGTVIFTSEKGLINFLRKFFEKY